VLESAEVLEKVQIPGPSIELLNLNLGMGSRIGMVISPGRTDAACPRGLRSSHRHARETFLLGVELGCSPKYPTPQRHLMLQFPGYSICCQTSMLLLPRRPSSSPCLHGGLFPSCRKHFILLSTLFLLPHLFLTF
jgi:hypothetical protein